jgi:hypothetical protein
MISAVTSTVFGATPSFYVASRGRAENPHSTRRSFIGRAGGARVYALEAERGCGVHQFDDGYLPGREEAAGGSFGVVDQG